MKFDHPEYEEFYDDYYDYHDYEVDYVIGASYRDRVPNHVRLKNRIKRNKEQTKNCDFKFMSEFWLARECGLVSWVGGTNDWVIDFMGGNVWRRSRLNRRTSDYSNELPPKANTIGPNIITERTENGEA